VTEELKMTITKTESNNEFPLSSKKLDSKKALIIQNDASLSKLNLGCGIDVRPAKKNWINVDGINAPDVLLLNLFKLPWPFESESFDYILARHVLEHVPHNIPEYGYEKNFLQVLLEEVWRIMKPGAIIDIEVPSGIQSIACAIDHKRIVTPESLHIFFPDDKYSYYTSCRFEQVGREQYESNRFKLLRKFLRKYFDVDITQLNPHSCRFFLRKI
jgi:predicted SAM-dependent methyltransferase